nr:hypothetical protein [Saprospiraceae bacterium]
MSNLSQSSFHQKIKNCDVFYLGIRHHGPGCARALRSMLSEVQPDVILLEFPADGHAALDCKLVKELCPPVALALYNPNNPGESVFYPLTSFSPEWIAIEYASQSRIPLFPIDIPSSAVFNIPAKNSERMKNAKSRDLLFEKAGIEDPEKFWDELIEESTHTENVFQYIFELMTYWRGDDKSKDAKLQAREAFMRVELRKHLRSEGFKKIAVITGAYHSKLLSPDLFSEEEDKETLKDVQQKKTEATWIPWTYHRISRQSGYGAGVSYPGWYHHLYHHGYQEPERWFAILADSLRKGGMKISPARVIDATRLATALSHIRGGSMPGFNELREAFLTCMAGNQMSLWNTVEREVLIGHQFGSTGTSSSQQPIERDFSQKIKSFRLSGLLKKKEKKSKKLDLRKDLHLETSQFLHRLNILKVFFGSQVSEGQGKTSSFSESWDLLWREELRVGLIEAGLYGNTVEDAAIAKIDHQINEDIDIDSLADQLLQSLLAGLSKPINGMVSLLKEKVAVVNDFSKLIPTVGKLTTAAMYGSVRKYSQFPLLSIIEEILPRICIGFPSTCVNVDYTQARERLQNIDTLKTAIYTLDSNSLDSMWQDALADIHSNSSSYPLIAGFTTRLLRDLNELSEEELLEYLIKALSGSGRVEEKSNWLEGFLTGGLISFLYDRKPLKVVHEFISTLDQSEFMDILPVLRRSFANASPSQRSRLLNTISELEFSEDNPMDIKPENISDETGLNKDDLPSMISLILYE